MTHENFVYWLQGFFEISDIDELNPKQTAIIKDHLEHVLKIGKYAQQDQVKINGLGGHSPFTQTFC